MNAVTQSSNADLQVAFKQFNKISEQFTFAYRDLENRFKQLKLELSDTKSKRIAELAEKERLASRLHLLLTVLHMGVVVVADNGDILESNHAADELLNLSLRGLAWPNVLQQVFPDAELKDISEICVNGKNLHIASKTIPNSSDSLVLISDVTAPIAHVDSVKRKERLAFLGNAIASIAHDIRTPLAASYLQLSNLDKSLKEKDIANPSIENIRQSLKSLESTLNNMLMYAKGNADNCESVNCKKLSEAVISDLLEYFPNTSLSIRTDDQINNHSVKVNTNAIITCIRNLITNAKQVSSSEIDVSVHFNIDMEGMLLITVNDNGPGVNKEIKEKIFDPFFTTKKNGTGLGLSIVKSIVDSHKGQVSVENNLNGASFKMQLPID